MSNGCGFPLPCRELIAQFGGDRWSGIVQLVWSAIERGHLYIEVGGGFYYQVQMQDAQSISSC